VASLPFFDINRLWYMDTVPTGRSKPDNSLIQHQDIARSVKPSFETERSNS
jgi:hypothetical protein